MYRCGPPPGWCPSSLGLTPTLLILHKFSLLSADGDQRGFLRLHVWARRGLVHSFGKRMEIQNVVFYLVLIFSFSFRSPAPSTRLRRWPRTATSSHWTPAVPWNQLTLNSNWVSPGRSTLPIRGEKRCFQNVVFLSENSTGLSLGTPRQWLAWRATSWSRCRLRTLPLATSLQQR